MRYFYVLSFTLFMTACGSSGGDHHPVMAQDKTQGGPGGGIGYTSDVKPIFANHCSACHPSRSGPDWLDYNQAKGYALDGKLVRRAVREKSMPPPGSPQAASITDKERALLGRWAEAGAPLNASAGGSAAPGPSAPGHANLAPSVVQNCLQCHGAKGPGIEAQPKIPRLGGQQKDYIVQQLERFKWRDRLDPTDQMNDIAGRMSEAEMQEAAAYYAGDHGLLHEETQAVGGRQAQEFIRGGAMAKMFCNSCHMNTSRQGRSSDRLVPLLGGQSKQYMMNQLLYFRNDERLSPLMHEYASKLSNQNIEDLATYFSLY